MKKLSVVVVALSLGLVAVACRPTTPPGQTWSCSISTRPGLQTVLLSGAQGPTDTGLRPIASPLTADHYTYAAVGTVSFSGTGFPVSPQPIFGALRYGLINDAGQFVLPVPPHAGFSFDQGGGNGSLDPPSIGRGTFSSDLIADGANFTVIASLGFGTTWRWAVVRVDESGGSVLTPPADSVPVCTSNAFYVPNCPDSNGDGTCPFHPAFPPRTVGPPAWTCSVTTSLLPIERGPNLPVQATATASGALDGWPTIRLTQGPNVASDNYAQEILFIHPIGGPIAAAIGAGGHASGVAPGVYTVGVYQNPWSFRPICTNTVTVPPASP